jgi:hypothetical protein
MNTIKRWIFSPLEEVPSPKVDEARQGAEMPEAGELAAAEAAAQFPPYHLPVCRQYARQFLAPIHEGTHALVLCQMDPDQLMAALKDPRLTVLDPTHEHAPLPYHVADHHLHRGVKRGHTLAQALKQLESLHIHFMRSE